MPPLAIPPVAYEQMFPAMMAHYMQHMAQFMPMFQPAPPPQPQPRIVTFKALKDNGAEEFRGDKMGEPQIALDWLEQMDRDPHTPKPWTWDRFDRAFTKVYVPTRYREERRGEFVALKQEGMSLPELRQRFDYLSQYATSLVSTPEDRLNEFVKKLRPDLRPYAALITTTDFNAAYDLIVKTEKSLDDLQATKKEDRATKDPRPVASTGPSGKSFGFGGKRYEKGSSSAPPPKRSKSRSSPSAAASNSNRTRSHPQCVHCGRHHPGECWLTQGLCLGCGQPGHFRRHCPTNPSSEPILPRALDQPAASHPARSQQSTVANNQQRPRPQQSGRAPARTYAMHGRTDPSPDVILGTFILFDSVMHALIDPGSTLSYICVGMPANSAIPRRRKPAAQPIVAAQQVAQARPPSPVAGSQALLPSPPAAAIAAVQLEQPPASPFIAAASRCPASPFPSLAAAPAKRRCFLRRSSAAVELQRHRRQAIIATSRCFLRLQPPSLTAVSQRRSLIATAELQRRRCFLRR
ncbi:unnamed protein product [Cuscuta campestris]|uniref:CCHC-type domain-containing protein n=1 Tax=Cuscuta campestris TaxID=132261 RepID=A0A484NK35_9ASTE|nr:unnamed protein product [Cuscuta campestris]